MGRLELTGIGKQFGKDWALRKLNLEIGPGEIVGLTGPSGAGKTTTCRIIAGFEMPSEGEVRIDGKAIDSIAPQNRDTAFMFESYALYPHFTVFDNIAFPLRASKNKGKYTRKEIGRRVRELTEFVEIEALESRFPHALSGGQRQRVALCRALVQEPSVYLFDEPISHLDAKLSHRLRGEIRRRLVQMEAPTLWTTPNAMEAISVSDRVAFIVRGRVLQIGSPHEVYRRPTTVEVGRLVGDPPLNTLTGRLVIEGDDLVFRNPALRLPLPDELRDRLEINGKGREIVLGIRPTEIKLMRGSARHDGPLGEVYIYEPFGKYAIVTVSLGDDMVKVRTKETRPYRHGETARLNFDNVNFLAFDPSTGQIV